MPKDDASTVISVRPIRRLKALHLPDHFVLRVAQVYIHGVFDYSSTLLINMPAIKAPATVLVTGANGFIGAWVCKALLDAGYTVR